jgi:hypothetical protein
MFDLYFCWAKLNLKCNALIAPQKSKKSFILLTQKQCKLCQENTDIPIVAHYTYSNPRSSVPNVETMAITLCTYVRLQGLKLHLHTNGQFEYNWGK